MPDAGTIVLILLAIILLPVALVMLVKAVALVLLAILTPIAWVEGKLIKRRYERRKARAEKLGVPYAYYMRQKSQTDLSDQEIKEKFNNPGSRS
jgi:Na+/H+-translocating membrane pyrophosphatase